MVYPVTKRITNIILKPFRGQSKGIENIPKDKGAILCANHASYMDHLVIGNYILNKMNKVLYFLAKKEHFDTFFQRQWHKYVRAIPLDRQSGGVEALKKAIEHLNRKDLIMIYPEGTRTLTGKMNRAKTGVARLALAAHVPVIPIGVTNTFRILPKGKIIPKWGIKSDINVGKPIYLDEYYGKENNKKVLRIITTKIMKEIAKLAKTEYEYD